MQTPYDWQEAIGHRAQFIENRLAQGTPAVAVSIEAGILLFTYRKEAGKIYEVYDQLAMAGLGQQSDIEAIRMAALDFAHQEGFQRSEKDVTVKRVVTAVSTPIKRAFADFSSAPVIARALFASVGDSPASDRFVMLEYDGDFHARRYNGYVAPTAETARKLAEALDKSALTTASVDTAIKELESIWSEGLEPDPSKTLEARMSELRVEIALLAREESHQNRFRYLTETEE